ncbi:AraC family transcriptional regulator [Paenibacillus cisolokensis]|uniref:AraC family transcriptional regulator n=1 Tax=Paenibacillus cisolokensis TaxID=1658519 RepID=UPI003D29B266
MTRMHCNGHIVPFEGDREIRYDLPFEHLLDNLGYIGIVARQTWKVDPHSHPHYELCLVDEGEGWFAIGSSLYKVARGDLFLTKPGEVHQGAASGDQPFSLYYLGFRLGELRNLEVDFFRIGAARVRPDIDSGTRALFDALFREIRVDEPYGHLLSQGLLLQLLVHVYRLYRGGETDREAALPPARVPAGYIPALLMDLHGDAGAALTIDELCARYHVSRPHLTREFRRVVGMPIGEYRRRLCVDQAKHSLRETDQTVSSIAESLGFSSIHAFSVFFKRCTGMSPLQYRQMSAEGSR